MSGQSDGWTPQRPNESRLYLKNTHMLVAIIFSFAYVTYSPYVTSLICCPHQATFRKLELEITMH